jgi:uncharacterized protein
MWDDTLLTVPTRKWRQRGFVQYRNTCETVLINARLIQLLICVLILAGGSEAIAAQGGGCASAQGSVVRAICSDPKLSQLNREVRALYQKALLAGDRQSRIEDQRNWVIERNRTCGKSQRLELGDCIVQSLNARILELRNVLEPTPTSSEKLTVASPPAEAAPAPKVNSNCGGANGVIDGAICNDPTLRHWEERLGKLYKQASDEPSSRSVLAQDQQRWIGERTGSCGSLSSNQMADCVLQMTKRRIEQFAQLIISRDDSQGRASAMEKILSGKTTPPPGLDADSVDRESTRADQSELAMEDARACIRKNIGTAGSVAASDPGQLVQLMSGICFDGFSSRLSALDLGALAKPSFEMLVHQELSALK